MANITYRDAVGKALHDSMREESRLIIIGQNLTGHALKSLAETYGAERVRDCSISESAMVHTGFIEISRRNSDAISKVSE